MKTDYEDKYQPWKRIAGVLTAPVSGSLSKKVKEEIFGLQDEGNAFGIGIYGNHWTEQLSNIISIGFNFVMPSFIGGIYPNPSDIPKILTLYGVYKGLEGVYRIGEQLFSDCATCSGSLEGTLISKAFIEPFLKKEKK
jgi:hypothetical protein